MILEKFYTDGFDSESVLVYRQETLTISDLKKYVWFQKKAFDKNSENAVVLLGDNSFEFIVNFFAGLFSNKQIYLLADKNRLKMLKTDYFLPQKFEKAAEVNFKEIDPKNCLINFFTSGSTAQPKIITKNFENLENEACAVSKQFRFDKNLQVYSTTIMPHMFGLTFHFMLPMYLGLVINTNKVDFPEQMIEENPYMLISSPSFLEKMAKYEVDFPSFPKRIITAGDKLKENVYSFFAQKSDIIEIYGSTETGVIAYKNGTKNFKTFDEVGISQSENGCITVKSNFFMEKEIKMEDVIEKVSDNEFSLKGRNDRIVKIKEKRVSLAELETALKTHKSVNDAYCFKYGDVLACAVITNDFSLNDTVLREHLAKYSEIIPKKWRFLDELPKTDTGKTDKEKLEQIFGMNLTYPFVFNRRIEENFAELELCFRKKSNFFNGHFPSIPVLAGVVQLFYANWFAKEVFKTDLSKKEAKRIKFTNIIRANQKVVLRLKNNENNVEYSYIGDDRVYSSGIFVKD